MESEQNGAASIHSALEKSLYFPMHNSASQVCEQIASASIISGDSLLNSEMVQVQRQQPFTSDGACFFLRRRLRRKLYLRYKSKGENATNPPEKELSTLEPFSVTFRREMTTIPEERLQFRKPCKQCFKFARCSKAKVFNKEKLIMKRMFRIKPEMLQDSIPEDMLEHFKAIQI